MNTSAAAATVDARKTWFGHPRQLARLFTTEMWERFGYYGMRAILVLYLADHFLFDDTVSTPLYGAFTALVYLTPFVGGLIADKYLGSKRSVKLGAILMSIGYFILCFGGEHAKPTFEYQGRTYAVESVKNGEKKTQFVVTDAGKYQVKGREDGSIELIGSDGTTLPPIIAKGQFDFDGKRDPFFVSLMFLGLAAVVIGNGFFKPNISTIVGALYEQGDRRRDAGFTIFYMGINLGSIISQFFCPLFAQWFGWWAGFLLAAGGMAIAWALFQFDGGRLDGYGEPPVQEKDRSLLIYVGAILSIPLAWFLMNNAMVSAQAAQTAAAAGTGVIGWFLEQPLLGRAMVVTFLGAVIGIPIWSSIVGTKQERDMMIVAIVLCVFNVVFWTLFEQAGSSLTYFADRNTDRVIDVLSYTMPAGQTQIFNPICVVLFAPVISWVWFALGKRGLEPTIPVKFAFGLAQVGLGFLVLVYGAQFADSNFKVGLSWLFLAYLLHSTGELCLSPVGLSMITKLSIARIVGMMMGVWFLSIAMAQYAAGIVAKLASSESVGGEVLNPKLSLDTYTHVFQTIGLYSIGAGALLFLLSPLLKRLSHGVK